MLINKREKRSAAENDIGLVASRYAICNKFQHCESWQRERIYNVL